LDVYVFAKDPRNVTKGLVALAEDIAALGEDRERLAEDPFVVPRDPCLSAADLCLSTADLVFPIEEPSSFRRDIFVLAEARCQHAKALCLQTEALCRLPVGLLSFTACGCKASVVLCSPAMALCMVAKDLQSRSEILVPRTTDLHQEAEDLVSSAKGLREEPKDIHRKPDDLSPLAEDLCPYPKVLVQETRFLFRWNNGHSVISKSDASSSKDLSHVSTPLRLESESLFAEPKRLRRQAAARSATKLAPPSYLGGQRAISSDRNRRFVGGGAPSSGADTGARGVRALRSTHRMMCAEVRRRPSGVIGMTAISVFATLER
jgi:hypothetical protein